MSTVTKVFIVLQLVFSIALGTMAIVNAGQTQDYRGQVDKLSADLGKARDAARTAETTAKAQREKDAQRIAVLEQDLSAAREAGKTFEAQTGVIQAKLDKASIDNTELSASLKGVSASLEVELGRAERLEAKNNELLASTADLRQRNLDLNERVRDLTMTVSTQQIGRAHV